MICYAILVNEIIENWMIRHLKFAVSNAVKPSTNYYAILLKKKIERNPSASYSPSPYGRKQQKLYERNTMDRLYPFTGGKSMKSLMYINLILTLALTLWDSESWLLTIQCTQYTSLGFLYWGLKSEPLTQSDIKIEWP